MSDSFDASTYASQHVLPGGEPEVLGHGDQASGPRRGRRLAVVGGALAVATLTGAGIAVGMALSGGGGQPEDVVPAGAVFYADVDLDPSAAQKVNAVRFLRSFPAVEDAIGSGEDLRASVVDALFDSLSEASDIDAATQIDPWLGSRYAVAVLDVDGEPEPMVVLQTTDTAEAEAALPGLLDGSAGFTVVDDYVVIAQSQQTAEQLASSGAQAPLSEDASFTDAMGSLGDGVATVYLDQGGAGDLLRSGLGRLGGVPGLGTFGSSATGLVDGTLGAVVRFEPDALEVVASADTALDAPSEAVESLVATLPETTVAALGVAGAADSVDEQWRALSEALDSVGGADVAKTARQRFGLRLPEDIKTLLGDDVVVAVDTQSPDQVLPGLGVRSLGDPAAAADLVVRLQPLLDQAAAGLGVVATATDDGLVVATTPEYADRLAAGQGGLGASAVFTRAVPDASSAQVVLFVNLDAGAGALAPLDPSTADVLGPLEAVGLSASTVDGRSTALLRVTLD